jgi:hypothetical protein
MVSRGYEEVDCAVRTARLRKEVIHDAQPTSRGWLMDLAGMAAAADERTGVIWTHRSLLRPNTK